MNRNAITLAVALAFGGVAAFAAASAATPANATRKPMLSQLDANGDGQLSRDEAAKSPRLSAAFDRLDSNRDGQLSRDELHAARAHGKHRPKIDVNGDGVISRDEAQASPRLAQNFDRLDSNRDGSLSREELRAGRPARHGGHRGAGEQAKVDVNGDGLIARDEAKTSPFLTRHFDAIDGNRDGLLSREELSAWRQAHRAQRSAPKQ